MGRKVGAEPLLGGQAGSPSNTVVWAEAYLCTNGMLYAMRVLRVRGTPATSLHDIFHAIVVSRIEYAAPA